MSSRSQYSAKDIPLPKKGMIYITPNGRRLCAIDAAQYIQHMVRRKVNGYTTTIPEICDNCGRVI